MSWYVLIPLIATFTNFSLGLGVFLSDVRNPIRRIFALFCFCLTFWNLCCAMMYYLPQGGAAFWAQLLLVPLVFIGPTFFHFVLNFIRNQSNFKKRLCIAGYVFGGGLLILNRISPIVVDVKMHRWFAGDWGYYPQVSDLTRLIDFQFLSLMIYGIYLLVKQYANETSSVSRNQIKYLFTGIILALMSSSTNFTPFMGIELYPLGHLGQVFYNFIIAYAILRYRLLDINVFFKRGLLYITFLVLLFVFCVPATWVIMSLFKEQMNMNHVFAVGLMLVLTFPLSYWAFTRVKIWMGQQLLMGGKGPIARIEQLGNQVLSDTGQNVNNLVSEIITKLSDILDVSGGCMFFLEAKGKKYDLVSAIGCCSDNKKDASIPINNSPLIDILLDQRIPIVKGELELKASNNSFGQSEGEKLLAAVAQLDEFGIAVCIPLITRGVIVGLLNVGQKKSGRLFPTEELNKLATLGNQIAIALENAKLLQESRNKANEQETLSQIASEIMSMHNPIELEKQIFTHIGNIIDYDKCLYLRWSDETESLVLEYAEGFDESTMELLKQNPFKVENHENEVNTFDDKSGDNFDAEQIAKLVENHLDEKEMKQSEEFSLSIPLFMKRKLYGVFCVFRTQVPYSEEQKRLLIVVGSQIIALHERMASTLARAETEAMTRALRAIRHDMSYALGSLRLSFGLMQERFSEMSETGQRVASEIREMQSDVEQLNRALKELGRLTDEKMRQEDVNAALNSALQLVEPRLSASKIEVIQDLQAGSMLIFIPAGQLTRVLFNLLLNAMEAMPQGGVLKLTTKLKNREEAIRAANSAHEIPKVPSDSDGEAESRESGPVGSVVTSAISTADAGEIAEITISDTGCGISDEDINKIFKYGFTTKASSGLGLAEVKRVINTCGGKIEVHSQFGVGTNFVIQLPCHHHL